MPVSTSDPAVAAPLASSWRHAIVAGAAVLLALVAWRAASFGWRMPVLALLGAGLGLSLYFASFGFAAAYRRMFALGDTSGVRAHVLLLALTTLLLAPVLAQGTFFGQPVHGATAPVGLQVAIGAFVFGIGMQLAGGCASGTLYTAGSGNPRMTATLLAFCAGAFWASLHLRFWSTLPQLPEIALGKALGWPVAIALQCVLFALAWAGLRRIGRISDDCRTVRKTSLWRGPWPLAWGAVALAALNLATLLVAGHPWVITWGFTLWGAKAAALAGWSPGAGDLWSAGYFRAALAASAFADGVSIMNIGILIGALLAAGLGGFRRPVRSVAPRSLAAALLGGLLLGYGARIAYGCNIGAFVSGIASTSLHGWLWIFCALPGNWVGMKLRPAFGLGAN